MTDSLGVASGVSSVRESNAFLAILAGGLIIGVVDLAYAIVVYSPHKPILIPQTIASGVLGPQSYDLGIPSAVM